MATVEKKLVKSKSGYRMVIVDERIASPFTIEEPPWMPDYAATNCQNSTCKVRFDFLTRKHHCRRCGKCFCSHCCSILVALPRMCFIDPVRHCRPCASVSKREHEFFDKHLKILLDGGLFRLYKDSGVGDSSVSSDKAFRCSLSPDHRYLQFEGNMQEQESISVQKIVSVQVAGAELDHQGNQVGKGIAIQYMTAAGASSMLKMDVEESSPSRQQSMSWVTAMFKAFKLVNESHSPSSSP